MILPPQQAEQFYRVWFALLGYVNRQLHRVPSLPSHPDPSWATREDAIQLRDALWADDSLRQAFLAQNPAGLAPADLALVESWKHRRSGKFFVLRHLKKYSVLLERLEEEDAETRRAYGVLGLERPWGDLVGDKLPLLVEAVLLPFGHQIAFDGVLVHHPLSLVRGTLLYHPWFGSEDRGALKRLYQDAQEREGTLTSLLPEDQANQAQILARRQKLYKKLSEEFRRHLARSPDLRRAQVDA